MGTVNKVPRARKLKPLYYVKGNVVYQRPVEHKRLNGSVNVSMGFAVCEVRDGVSPKAVAALLEKGARG